MKEGLLKGKQGIITGGTRGIGRSICHTFAKEGASFILIGRDAEKGAILERELLTLSPQGKFTFCKVDVGSEEAIGECVKNYLAEWGRIDFLVNNAGVTRDRLLMQMKPSEWEEVLRINLHSVYAFCHHAIRAMLKSGGGSIINLSSVVALRGNPGQTNYCAAKSGIIGFTQSLAKEVGSRKIRVNAVAPGFIATEMTAKLTQEQQERILANIPLGRMGTAPEIADVVLFLASEMSRYITGSTLVADGGMSA